MSMQPRPWPEVPESTARVARAAFPKGSLAMRVRDELGPMFADAQFAQAFGRRGRRGISPGQLALVSVLQFADNLTDRQAADAVRGRIDWKYALGLELSDPGFDHTVLTGFRGRLLEHGLERRVLDVLLGRLGELGVVAWGASGDRPPGGALIQTPYDPQARYGEKRGVGWTGYKVHLTETCDGVATGRPQLITNVATTDAAVPDARLTRRVHAGLAQHGLLPAEHLVDQGYTSAHLLVSSLRDHGVVLLGPVAGDSSPQGVARTGFDHTAFAIDFDRQQVTCPQGVTTSNWTKTRDRSGLEVIIARFPTKICRACPVRDHCTTAKWTGRQLCFRPRDQHAALVRARAEQATHAWRQRYATRAGIEATIHQAVATTGIRRTRYVGLPKTHLGNIFAAAAINLIRLDAYWTGTPLGKTRTTHLARLALTLTA